MVKTTVRVMPSSTGDIQTPFQWGPVTRPVAWAGWRPRDEFQLRWEAAQRMLGRGTSRPRVRKFLRGLERRQPLKGN
jgi:hypothetical protein